MVLHNCLKILNDISHIERKINELKKFSAYGKGLQCTDDELLIRIIEELYEHENKFTLNEN